jgi:glycosyltransferase involved in cell wall biosynthesis
MVRDTAAMTPTRLRILSLSQIPPSPPRFGAQARVHGLWSNLGRGNDLTAVVLLDADFDADECRGAMEPYCREVVLIPNPNAQSGPRKRALQLRSLLSRRSFERHLFDVRPLRRALDSLLRRDRFDVVHLEFPYLGHLALKVAPPGAPAPKLVLDTHEIAYDMVRQFSRSGHGLFRRGYAAADWRKLRREEVAAFRAADGIAACSAADAQRIRDEHPGARTVVIPNAADVDFYQTRPGDPSPDGETILFFGLMSTLPNTDGILWFLHEIWPKIAAARPSARLQIVGSRPPPAVRAFAGPRVEVAGFVEDLRPKLAAAAVLIVPLRLGGGTRLKIVEGMAMNKAIVSTSLGAEGIDAVPGRDLLLADDPDTFASSVLRVLGDKALAERLGTSARALAVAKYAWSAAVLDLERFYRELLDRP